MDFLSGYQIATGILGSLWILSESLAQIPSIKSNSVFQLVSNFLARFRK